MQIDASRFVTLTPPGKHKCRHSQTSCAGSSLGVEAAQPCSQGAAPKLITLIEQQNSLSQLHCWTNITILLLDSSCYVCRPQYGTMGTCRVGNQLMHYQLRDFYMSSILWFSRALLLWSKNPKSVLYNLKCLLPYSQKFTPRHDL